MHLLTVLVTIKTELNQYSLPSLNPSRVTIIGKSETNLAPTFCEGRLNQNEHGTLIVIFSTTVETSGKRRIRPQALTGIMETNLSTVISPSTDIRLSGNTQGTIVPAFAGEAWRHYFTIYISIMFNKQFDEFFWRIPRAQVSYMLARYYFPYHLLLID